MSTTLGGATDSPQGLREVGWPAWQVPDRAAAEWAVLQEAIEDAVVCGRRPVCRRDPEVWWATAGTPASAELQAAAVEACSWCPVLGECREYGVAAGEREGVWGGLTPAERRRARG